MLKTSEIDEFNEEMYRLSLDGLTSEKVGAVAGSGSDSEDEDWEGTKMKKHEERREFVKKPSSAFTRL